MIRLKYLVLSFLSLLVIGGCSEPPAKTAFDSASSVGTPQSSSTNRQQITADVTQKTAPAETATKDSPLDKTDRSGQEVEKAFLDQTKEVAARMEWVREITSRRGGPIRFRVTAQGSFAVTLITDKGYKALIGNQKVSKEDVLLILHAKEPTLERSLTIAAGSTWFILENRTDKPLEFRLQCFED